MLQTFQAQQRWERFKSELDRTVQENHKVTLNINVIQSPDDTNTVLGLDAQYTVDDQPYTRTFFETFNAQASTNRLQMLIQEEVPADLESLCLYVGNYIVAQLPSDEMENWTTATLMAETDMPSILTYGFYQSNTETIIQRSFSTDYRGAVILDAIRRKLEQIIMRSIHNLTTTIRADGSLQLHFGKTTT
ncbi:MAG TPA: hypothetical protein P5121_37995 [Caldilineaceae bacterium]|nr:hypothetical protein [Caldilineaceae bacterium]